ncbi:MAG: hypothetical protein ACK4N5_26460, partial [Myxococcales bacterium]
MASRKKSNARVFEDTASVLAWMEDEYLSALTIADLAPVPVAEGGAPDAVTFTWWLDAPGARTPYRVEASGVREWRLLGELGRGEIFMPPPEPGLSPIVLVMEVPGRLTLACTRLRIEKGREVKKPHTARPFTDYAYYTLDGAGRPTPALLARALSDAPAAALRRSGSAVVALTMGPHTLELDGR